MRGGCTSINPIHLLNLNCEGKGERGLRSALRGNGGGKLRAKAGVCYKMRGGGVNCIIYNLYNNNKFITIIKKYYYNGSTLIGL